VSTLARSTAPVFVTPVLLGVGYETTAATGAGSVGSAAGGGGVQLEAAPAADVAAACASNALARSTEKPVVESANRIVVVGRQPGPKEYASVRATGITLHAIFTQASSWLCTFLSKPTDSSASLESSPISAERITNEHN
jgi:hypothetical protein